MYVRCTCSPSADSSNGANLSWVELLHQKAGMDQCDSLCRLTYGRCRYPGGLYPESKVSKIKIFILLPTALNVLRPIFLPVFVTNLLHPLFLFQISLATDCRSKKTTRNCYNCREVVQGKRLQNFFLLQPMTSYITAVFIKLGHSRPLFHLFMCFFKQKLQCLQQYYVKIVHPVSNASI